MRRRYEENKSKKNSENRWSSRILQLRWTLNLLLLVLLSFSLSSVFLFRPSPSLFVQNIVLFIEHEVWPNFGGISEPFALGKRRRSASAGLADRSVLNSRSIGAYAFLRNSVSRSIGLHSTIDRRFLWLASRSWADRSANDPRSIGDASAFFVAFLQTLADRSANELRSIGDASAFRDRYPLLQNVPFCVFFHLDFRTCA